MIEKLYTLKFKDGTLLPVTFRQKSTVLYRWFKASHPDPREKNFQAWKDEIEAAGVVVVEVKLVEVKDASQEN